MSYTIFHVVFTYPECELQEKFTIFLPEVRLKQEDQEGFPNTHPNIRNILCLVGDIWGRNSALSIAN